jgi:hypothetical protein
LPEELQLLAQTTSAALENIGLAREDLHEEWIGPGNSINDLVSNEQEPFRYKCQEVREALVGTLEVLSLRLASLLSRMRSMQVEIDLRGVVDEDEVYMENEETTWDDSSEVVTYAHEIGPADSKNMPVTAVGQDWVRNVWLHHSFGYVIHVKT